MCGPYTVIQILLSRIESFSFVADFFDIAMQSVLRMKCVTSQKGQALIWGHQQPALTRGGYLKAGPGHTSKAPQIEREAFQTAQTGFYAARSDRGGICWNSMQFQKSEYRHWFWGAEPILPHADSKVIHWVK